MVPDLPYWFPPSLPEIQAHRGWAMLTFGLPVGLLCWGVFHGLLRGPMTEALPESWRRRVPPFGGFDGVAVVLGLLLGIGTHLLWDDFTHSNGFVVMHWPLLHRSFGPFTLYRVLQHGSTLFGLWALWQATQRWVEVTPARRMGPLASPHLVRGMGASGLLVGMGLGVLHSIGGHTLGWVLRGGFIGAMTGLVGAMVLAGALLSRRRSELA